MNELTRTEPDAPWKKGRRVYRCVMGYATRSLEINLEEYAVVSVDPRKGTGDLNAKEDLEQLFSRGNQPKYLLDDVLVDPRAYVYYTGVTRTYSFEFAHADRDMAYLAFQQRLWDEANELRSQLPGAVKKEQEAQELFSRLARVAERAKQDWQAAKRAVEVPQERLRLLQRYFEKVEAMFPAPEPDLMDEVRSVLAAFEKKNLLEGADK